MTFCIDKILDFFKYYFLVVENEENYLRLLPRNLAYLLQHFEKRIRGSPDFCRLRQILILLVGCNILPIVFGTSQSLLKSVE